jgi:hypothetical protein
MHVEHVAGPDRQIDGQSGVAAERGPRRPPEQRRRPAFLRFSQTHRADHAARDKETFMAFFCNQTGVRIVAPGVCDSARPDGVPAFDGSDASVAAEHAALAVLRAERLSETESSPSASAEDRARAAAKKALAPRLEKTKAPAPKPDDEPAKGGRRPAKADPPKSDNI